MTVDDFLGLRRYKLLGLATVVLATSAIAGAAFLGVHGWHSKTEVFAPPPAPPSLDPVQTGSVAGADTIGEMIENLDSKEAGRHP